MTEIHLGLIRKWNFKFKYFKNCVKVVNLQSIRYFEQIQDVLRKNIEICKEKYYFKLPRNLRVNKTNPKCY